VNIVQDVGPNLPDLCQIIWCLFNLRECQHTMNVLLALLRVLLNIGVSEGILISM
jgi:hypothetical protein